MSGAPGLCPGALLLRTAIREIWRAYSFRRGSHERAARTRTSGVSGRTTPPRPVRPRTVPELDRMEFVRFPMWRSATTTMREKSSEDVRRAVTGNVTVGRKETHISANARQL